MSSSSSSSSSLILAPPVPIIDHDFLVEHLLYKVVAGGPLHSSRTSVFQVVGWTRNAEKPDAKIRNIFLRHIPTISVSHIPGECGVDRIDTAEVNAHIGRSLIRGKGAFFQMRLDPITESNPDICLRLGTGYSQAFYDIVKDPKTATFPWYTRD